MYLKYTINLIFFFCSPMRAQHYLLTLHIYVYKSYGCMVCGGFCDWKKYAIALCACVWYVDCVGRNNIHGRRCSVRVDNSWKYKSPGWEKQPLCTLPHVVRPSLSLVLSVAKADRINNDNIKYRWRDASVKIHIYTHTRARVHIFVYVCTVYIYIIRGKRFGSRA